MGVAARDLQECLLIQCRHLKVEHTLVGAIIKKHLKNLESKNLSAIAKDLKVPLAARLPKLAERVFHAKLGSVLDKVGRVERLADSLAAYLRDADRKKIRRAAELSKADLSTGMVSKYVTATEKRLGVRLLNRNSRGLGLTEARSGAIE